uniref:Uncharacterized protein n=1 Tax=Arundo donax TaxID=35708 RepID=A0A0A8Z912_ARUDO
MASTAVRVRS